jgi:hypothetical protein
MQYPSGLKKPIEIFEDYQIRFLAAYEASKRSNAEAAEAERNRIVAEKAAGEESFTLAWQMLAGFLVLMFFFLLVAIERHQRQLSVRSSSNPD